ncbi:hypothetical protein ACIQXU_12815 [Peribacillus sp. NPDC097284]|uniref:hypothetical protein n=1 Tax=Peribacillus sp. NPDC097284 TaxID=3364401 RepID=UPI00381BEFBF
MGFLKSAGEGAGWLVGGVTGGIIKGVGELTGSKFIQEVGDGVKNSTEFTGKQLGNVAEGVWNLGSGLVSKDDGKVDQGFKDLGDGVGNTAKAVGQGIKATVGNVGDVAGGLRDGDETRWKEGLRNVGKTVAVGALGVSILDMADVIDVNGNEGGLDGSDLALENGSDGSYIIEENHQEHGVEPHWRTLENGERIWIDGDGDSSINQSVEEGGGWNQSNPDYRIPVDEA